MTNDNPEGGGTLLVTKIRRGEARVPRGLRLSFFSLLALIAAAGVTSRIAVAQGAIQADATAGADWVAYGRTADESHYSPLSQINDTNVSQLGLLWSYDLPASPAVHGAPLAVNGALYTATGYSIVRAFDAGSGHKLWEFDPKVAEVAGDKLRPAWGIRGIAYWEGRIYVGTQDGRLIAVNTKTGRQAWSVQTTEGPDDGRYITGAPRTFDGLVIIGHGGADFAPVRGYVTAYNATTGKQVWRFYTVPGDPAKGFENPAMATAAKTWSGEWWKQGGGGAVWNAISYDPELDRVYLGTGSGAPWNRRIRSPGGGDNLFLCSIVALDAKTGRYLWHYQTTPGESWDFDSATDITLATLPIDGKPRRVILHAPKNGFFYVIDRETGKLISAKPFTKVTWASGVDSATGRPVENPDSRATDKPVVMWPGPGGAHSWSSQAFSPKTALVYIPSQELPGMYDARGSDPAKWQRHGYEFDSGYAVSRVQGLAPPPPGPLGSLIAWDPVRQQQAWSVPMAAPFNGGVAATAGNLVFEGTAEGHFVAYAADTGRTLWSFDAQNGIAAQPITYLADGRQLVTVIAGFGGISAGGGALVERFHWDYRDQARRVLTFALGGKETLPPARHTLAPIVDDANYKLDDHMVTQGADLFAVRCTLCHGAGAVAGGSAPDLRKSQVPLNADAFGAIVQGGSLITAGMPKFGDLTAEELESLRQYVRSQARATLAQQTAGAKTTH
jgi:quinohemoprotein ethanol dehydrogenase